MSERLEIRWHNGCEDFIRCSLDYLIYWATFQANPFYVKLVVHPAEDKPCKLALLVKELQCPIQTSSLVMETDR